MSSDGRRATRRYMLQTLGAVGAVGLAGCTGGNESTSDSSTEEPESSSDDGGSEQVEEEEKEPDYSLPESEHADITEMATNWMIMGDNHGDELEAVAYSPSKLAENYDRAFVADITDGVQSYSHFEFSHEDIPESFVQKAATPWKSHYKVDQLPNNVSEDDIVDQLQGSGFEKIDEKGGFEVYSDGKTPHAVGQDRHVVVLPGLTASGGEAERLMDRVVKEANQDAYEVPDIIRDGLDALDVRDSLTIENSLDDIGYTPSTGSGSLKPDYGMSSVDFQEGSKFGAWPFESESEAERAEDILSRRDELMNNYQSVGSSGRVVTASGDYDINEMNKDMLMRISNPRI